MSRSVFLSACLIVRDAEEDLAWCLSSLSGEVDEIIVVDTGSRDATKSIARKYTKHVFSFAWQDDFSAARNFALSKVHGLWVFFPDSDEFLAGETGALRRAVKGAEGLGEKALSILRREVDEQGHPAGMPENPAVRILRRGGGMAYHDPVHEYLAYPDGSAPAAPLVPADELYLLHRGYAPSRKAAKAQRNLAILERLEREGKKKLYLHFYLAGLYFDLGRYEDACRESELSLAAGEHPAVGELSLWKNYMTALEKRGRTRALQELCERALQEVPELPDTYARLGVDAMNRGNFAEGERLLQEAVQREAAFAAACPNDEDTFRMSLPQVQGLLAECRKQLGRQGDRSVEKEPQNGGQEVPTVWATVPKEPEVSPEEAARRKAAEKVADLLPPAARTIVLFGCRNGDAGQIFLQRSPDARIYGFTGMRAEAAAAGQCCTAAFVGTPEMVDLELYGLSHVDCIAYDLSSCGALTEAAVRRHASVLAAEGQVVFLAKPEEEQVMVQLSHILQKLEFQSVLVRADEGIVRACRAKTTSCAVQTLVGEGIVTARVRVTEPDGFLATEPGFAMAEDEQAIRRDLVDHMDTSIVIRQRKGYESLASAKQIVSYLREHHHILLYEIDDNPNRWPEKSEVSFHMDFIGSHAVQVSTPALADVIRPYNPHVFVFENQLKELPAPRDYAAEEQARNGRVTIFFGALNREEDYADILPVLNEAAKRYGDQLQFRVLADSQFYRGLVSEHKEYIADPKLYDGRYVPYPVYQRVLHTADISLLPLHNTEFNRTKSDLKFIESAAHGAVVLASPTVYERTVVDGCTGCIYHTPEEFAEKLQHLIEDKVYRHAIAAAAWQYVKDHRLLSQHYLERAEAYRWIIAHHEELDRELGERLEKLEKSEH